MRAPGERVSWARRPASSASRPHETARSRPKPRPTTHRPSLNVVLCSHASGLGGLAIPLIAGIHPAN